MPAISVSNLTKRFNGFTAVDHVSFEVKEGELFGLLGPNGAGKTTMINMLATLLKPTSGTAKISGFDISNDKHDVRQSIGVVFQEPALDDKLTGLENLRFHAMMYGISKKERVQKIQEILELIELKDKANVLVGKYSGGMKRRLEIGRGLIQRPKVLFLDEPTLGLDAQTRRHIWSYIKKLNEEHKVAIILTTHYMEEADYLCKRIAIFDYGKIVAMESPEKLKDDLGGDVVTLEIEDDINKYMSCLKDESWVKAIKKHGKKLSVGVAQGEKRIPGLITLAEKCGVSVASVHMRRPSLEDVFLHFTGKTIREREASQRDQNKEMMKRRFGH